MAGGPGLSPGGQCRGATVVPLDGQAGQSKGKRAFLLLLLFSPKCEVSLCL